MNAEIRLIVTELDIGTATSLYYLKKGENIYWVLLIESKRYYYPQNNDNMRPIKFTEATFSDICINDMNVKFSSLRIDRATVPPNLFAYDIRGTDDGECFGTIEPFVLINHTGTIISTQELQMDENEYISIK